MRTAAERERMYALLWEAGFPASPLKWNSAGVSWDQQRREYDNLLAAFPQLWDSLPPDPAEQARREAEEDREIVERWAQLEVPVYAAEAIALVLRMNARAKAGYDVLPPTGEG